jgi:hypothetical protein
MPQHAEPARTYLNPCYLRYVELNTIRGSITLERCALVLLVGQLRGSYPSDAACQEELGCNLQLQPTFLLRPKERPLINEYVSALGEQTGLAVCLLLTTSESYSSLLAHCMS